MHLPERTPRPSIYFRYEVHSPWLPQPGQPPQAAPVVIVGAGPAGLVTALELARHGVASIVLESELQVSLGSRAIVFTRRSLEILQQVGVADQMTQMGLPWRFGNSYYRGERVFRMEAPHDEDDRFFPMLNIQQQYLEKFLVDACAAEPLIELRWGNRVVALQQDEVRARLTCDTPTGDYELVSDWVVACDGGRSPLRSLLGLKLEGAAYEGLFVIADIRIDLPHPTERLAFFDPAWNPGNTVLMHREPHGMWRVDYQLPSGETPEQALEPHALRTRIDATLEMIGHAHQPWELDWASVYSARTLTLPNYRVGRVLFAGDAAHLLPIFGVRGANTAFEDAQSLGWHLGFVVKGLAPEALLANYSAERVTAAREIIAEAGKSTRFMTPPTAGFRLLRDAVLSLSLRQAFVRPLYHWRTSRPHEYTQSALNAPDDDDGEFDAGPAHGAPPRNVRLGPDDFLLDHLGCGFDLLMFLSIPMVPDDVLEAMKSWRLRGVPVRLTAIGAESVVGADHCIADAEGRISDRYGFAGRTGAVLLRPDQHVCGRWLRPTGIRLERALVAALGEGG